MPVIFFVMLVFCLLSSCSTADKQNAKNQWLHQNFPDREKHIKTLPNGYSEYEKNILQGEIVAGMSIEEILISSDTAPYGPKKYRAKFWCDNKSVNRCAPSCSLCEGFLLTDKEVVLLSGINGIPKVTNTQSRHTRHSMFASHSKQYNIAMALYNNKIIPGMSLMQANRVLQTKESRNYYYCNGHDVTNTEKCDASCLTCVIQLTPYYQAAHPNNTIYLENHYGLLTVTRVE